MDNPKAVEQKSYRWQKLVITLAAMAFAVGGLVYIANARTGQGQDFGSLVKAYSAYCEVLTYVTAVALCANVGEHWKKAAGWVAQKITGQKPVTK